MALLLHTNLVKGEAQHLHSFLSYNLLWFGRDLQLKELITCQVRLQKIRQAPLEYPCSAEGNIPLHFKTEGKPTLKAIDPPPLAPGGAQEEGSQSLDLTKAVVAAQVEDRGSPAPASKRQKVSFSQSSLRLFPPLEGIDSLIFSLY